MLDEGRVAGGADVGGCLIKLLTEDGVSPGKINAVTSPKRAGCEEGADGERPSKKVVTKKTPWSLPTDFKMPTIAEHLDISPEDPCMTLAAETVGGIEEAMLSDRKEACAKATIVWKKNTTPMWVSSSIYSTISTYKAYFCVSLKFDDTGACRFLRDTWVHITLGTWRSTSQEYKCPTTIQQHDVEHMKTFLAAVLSQALPEWWAIKLDRNETWQSSWSYELQDEYQKSVMTTLQNMLVDSAKLFGYDIEYPESLHVSWI